MSVEELHYETPMLAEVGGFAEITRDAHIGRWLDNPFITGWFL